MKPLRRYFFGHTGDIRKICFFHDHLEITDEEETFSEGPDPLNIKLKKSDLISGVRKKEQFGAYAIPFLFLTPISIFLTVLAFLKYPYPILKIQVLVFLGGMTIYFSYKLITLMRPTQMLLIYEEGNPIGYSFDVTKQEENICKEFTDYYQTWLENN